jgi:mRNA interferase RelE/StbE
VASYSLFIKSAAAKELERLPPDARRRAVVSRIRRLAVEPRPVGTEKLSGQEKYRIRQGDYRILYLIDDAEASVTAIGIAHRREAYR